MAYPRQIPPDTFDPPPPETQHHPPARPVAFTTDNIYVSLYQGRNPTQYIAVNKSTMAGDETPWAEMDSANHPEVSRSTYECVHVHRDTAVDGKRLYHTFAPLHSPFPPVYVTVQAFNMETDQWESQADSLNAPTPDDPSTNDGVVYNFRPQWGSVVRSNGDICTVYNDNSTSYTGGLLLSGLRMKIYSGGAWGSAIDILLPDENHQYNYELLGVHLGDDGERIHIHAMSLETGYYHIIVDASDVVRSQAHPFPVTSEAGPDRGHWGEPVLVTIGTKNYSALPVGLWIDNEGGSTSSRPRYKPGVLLWVDQDDPPATSAHFQEELVMVAASYICINIGSYGGAAYLIWTNADFDTLNTTLRISCTRGFGWSDPSDIYTAIAGELVEWHEVEIDSGTLRMVLENLSEADRYDLPHYAQEAVSCAATGCPAGSGGRTRVTY